MTVRIQFQLRDEVARLLEEQAAERGISRQAHVQDLIEAYKRPWTELELSRIEDAAGRGGLGLTTAEAAAGVPAKRSARAESEADRNVRRAAERLKP